MFRATPESPRMFESDLLDALSRTPFWVVPLVWLPILATSTWVCLRAPDPGDVLPGLAIAPGEALAAAMFGLLLWTLLEYVLHRFVFHWEPRTRWGARFHFLVHGVHHTWPKDALRLVLPPAASLLLGAGFLGLFVAVAGSPGVAGFVGLASGYLVYDLIHYAVHHVRPRFLWHARLRAHHNNHHFHDPTRRFGVSSPLWDVVFGTR